MPFDGTDNTPSLLRARLVDALRHVPASHEWNFYFSYEPRECGSAGCAVGLAYAMGIINDSYVHVLGAALGLSQEDETRLFDCLGDRNGYGVPTDEVTPEMVADALEAIGP